MSMTERQPERALIMASMLTADLARLGEDCRALERAGVDGIHWDIMDGQAVPSLSFGPEVVEACRPMVDLPFEVHVMSRTPEIYIDALAKVRVTSLTVHPDWIANPRRTLQRIADAGMVPGVALSPGTPVDYATWHLDLIGQILVMTVEPGFGGQSHILAMRRKVAEVHALDAGQGKSPVIEVDGGIAPDTIAPMITAGAGSCVVGSALWSAPSYAQAVRALHDAMPSNATAP